MDLASRPLGELLDALAAKSPVPGGGAVAPIVGSLAASLASMVVAYSLGRKSLAEHQGALEAAALSLASTRTEFLALADEDELAYGALNELLRLPEGDPRRVAGLSEAAERATSVPLDVVRVCLDLLRLARTLAPITNKNLRSDLAMSATLAEAAARASRWNVAINLPLLDPDTTALADADSLLADCREALADVERVCV